MRLWLIGGMDPSGGAGLLRDCWAACAFAPEVELACAVTVFTEQGDGRRARCHAVRHDVRAAVRALEPPTAIKIGLVPAGGAGALAAVLPRDVPSVVDPVLWATDGGSLNADVEGTRALANGATLLTPNLDEARALVGSDGTAEELAVRLSEGLGVAVLLKSARLDPGTSRIADLLVFQDRARWYERPMVPGPNPRGTGCALATVIAAELGRGRSIEAAVESAMDWLDVRRAATRTGRDGRPHLS